MSADGAPPERTETLRQSLRRLLEQDAWTTLELSGELRVSERTIIAELDQLMKGRLRVRVKPASCLSCGFEFASRKRAGKPGRCPQCKSERIAPARFFV